MLAVLSIVSRFITRLHVYGCLWVHEVERGGGGGDSFWNYCEVEHMFEVSMSVLCIVGLRQTKPHNVERL